MDTEGTIEKAPSLQTQAVADAKARRGADDEFLAIMFEDKKMSKVYPSSDKLHKGFRDKVLANAIRDLSLSVSNTMTASVSGHQAMCQSEKVRNMTPPVTSVSLQAYKPLVVDIVAQSLYTADYVLPKTDGAYMLRFVRTTDSDQPVTVQLEGSLTNLHLEVHICACDMGMDMLKLASYKKMREALLNEWPSLLQFIAMIQKHKLFDISHSEEPRKVEERVLQLLATYGAYQRRAWLADSSDTYPSFLVATKSYASYEAYAERDLAAYMSRKRTPEQYRQDSYARTVALGSMVPDIRKRSGSLDTSHPSRPVKARAGASIGASVGPSFLPIGASSRMIMDAPSNQAGGFLHVAQPASRLHDQQWMSNPQGFRDTARTPASVASRARAHVDNDPPHNILPPATPTSSEFNAEFQRSLPNLSARRHSAQVPASPLARASQTPYPRQASRLRHSLSAAAPEGNVTAETVAPGVKSGSSGYMSPEPNEEDNISDEGDSFNPPFASTPRPSRDQMRTFPWMTANHPDSPEVRTSPNAYDRSFEESFRQDDGNIVPSRFPRHHDSSIVQDPSELTVVEERPSAQMDIDTTRVSENTPMPDASPAQGG